MLVRIVKMMFKAEEVERFIQLFESRKEQIRHFEGCNHLELWQDKDDQCTFFTYSLWQNEESLHNYRNSQFFNETCFQTKQMFAAKPAAWSVQQMTILP